MSYVHCAICGREVNTGVETVWNLVEGWEHKRPAGGTNHLALRKPKDEFRCHGCMSKALMGIDPAQRSLLDV